MRAGFTDEQILREGPGVRTALATSGGAQVRDEQSILALFSVQNGLLYVSSRERGDVHDEDRRHLILWGRSGKQLGTA
jgi:hypothetical protein